MKTPSNRLNLRTIQNWPEIAGQVQYRAPALARQFKVSSRTLEREFRKQLQTTPQKYLDHVRQAVAEKLVMNGGRTKEIAIALEYKHASHFCRQFSVYHGMGARAWKSAAA